MAEVLLYALVVLLGVIAALQTAAMVMKEARKLIKASGSRKTALPTHPRASHERPKYSVRASRVL